MAGRRLSEEERESRERERESRAREERRVRAKALSKICAWCNTHFQATTLRQKFCCDHCNNVAKKNRRQARIRGGPGIRPPTLGEIFDRDKGVCQLCRKRVTRKRHKWPHPLSPSLDHIIPISERPWDDARNIQLAHLGCNMRKGAKKCGSQLRLIG
jgi:hypothetical protein